MKKLLFVLLTMILGFLISCDPDKSIIEEKIEFEDIHPFQGKWNLVSVSCFCPPIDLEKGEHIWTFDMMEDKLEVKNNVQEELHTVPASGSYDITLSEGKLKFDGEEYTYTLKEKELLLLDEVTSDGPLIRLVRD